MFKNLNLEALGVSGRQSEVIELALSNGFSGLDLDLVDFAGQVASHGLAHARRLLDSARLKFGSFDIPLDWEVDPAGFKQQLEQLTPRFELAQQLGCTRAVSTIEPASDRRPFHENYELHRRRYAELAEALNKYGIRLGIGFLAPLALRQGQAFHFVQSVDAFLLLFKSITGNVGVALDVWHWHLGGGTLDQLRSLGADKVLTVALADADPGMTAENANPNTRRLPGETGVIDSAGILTVLKELKFTGPVTPKPSKAVFQGLGRDKIVKQTATALDNVWKAAGLSAKPGQRPGVGTRG